MPLGAIVTPGWYLFGTTPALNVTVLPGGMAAVGGTAHFIMIVAGWVFFIGTPPL